MLSSAPRCSWVRWQRDWGNGISLTFGGFLGFFARRMHEAGTSGKIDHIALGANFGLVDWTFVIERQQGLLVWLHWKIYNPYDNSTVTITYLDLISSFPRGPVRYYFIMCKVLCTNKWFQTQLFLPLRYGTTPPFVKSIFWYTEHRNLCFREEFRAQLNRLQAPVLLE